MDHDAGAAGQASQVGQLDWLIDDLVRRVGLVSKAVILSQDGIALGASGTLERDDAEHLIRRSGEHIKIKTRASALSGWV